ncbi:MAG: response regulator [Deltaproteobacteria bacterium]|nr:MAG: response regulator [Deltaproteobacteria bacterium]
MPIITLFSGVFCGKKTVLKNLKDRTGYKHVTDDDIVKQVELLTGLQESKIRRAFSSKTSVFNEFTHEKECSIAHMRLAVAEMLMDEELIIDGFSSLLIPGNIDHVLRVCLVAEMPYRVAQAKTNHLLDEKEAKRTIRQEDGDRAAWIEALHSNPDPWAGELYDMVIPMQGLDENQAGALIEEYLHKNVLHKTEPSEKAYENFLLSSRVQAVLCKAGHDVTADAKHGAVVVHINKHVLMLDRLEDELKSIAGKVPGVKSVATRVDMGYQRCNIYRKHEAGVPSRVLLVDDEREFVQTLSERLQLRDMGSAVVYDGKSALNIVKNDEPEVIIIDLKMPGIDGIGVLKKVKTERPDIEVVVLTGHGSEKDRQMCMDLGAFDYLQKPVDINHLSKVLKNAHKKIQGRVQGA